MDTSPEGEGAAILDIFIIILLIVFSYDFTKMRQQNERMIEQNERILSHLEAMKNKSEKE